MSVRLRIFFDWMWSLLSAYCHRVTNRVHGSESQAGTQGIKTLQFHLDSDSSGVTIGSEINNQQFALFLLSYRGRSIFCTFMPIFSTLSQVINVSTSNSSPSQRFESDSNVFGGICAEVKQRDGAAGAEISPNTLNKAPWCRLTSQPF